MTKLILHVGLGKTGTTAFQDAIRDSFEPLREAGFLCAGPRLKFAVPEGEELEAQYLAGEPEHLASALASLEKAAASNPDVTTVIWSNETIGMAPDLPAVVQVIERFIDNSSLFKSLEIAICLRRQDDWVESAYRQWGLKHKMMQSRGIEAPEDWLDRNWDALDYLGLYRIWAALGADRIRVLTYDDMRKAGGSVPFLCKVFEIPSNLILTEAMGEKNVSLGPAQSYLNALHNGTHEGPVRPVEFGKVFQAYDLPELDDKNSSFVSTELRQKVLDRCVADNDELAKLALGRDKLFGDFPVGGGTLYKNGNQDALFYLSRIVGEQQKLIDDLSDQLTNEHARRLRDLERPFYQLRKLRRRLREKFGLDD
ncbi:hypothetical protein [Aliiroseovarius sp. S253]|uniref:hypothetical protein n=1 Tax=Aliiroseovarius sp. S253 TaxID=3415133 RepID=UPI003C7B969B